MKQRLIGMVSVFILTLLFAAGFASQAQAADSLLRVGSTGTQVVDLQTKLNYVGFSVGKVDGIFGNMTLNAVKEFQASANLSVDGIVGPITSQALNSAYAAKQSGDKASAIIATAEKYIGVPYQWGGSTPSGFDCSGFTSYVFAQNGITIPRISRDQYTIGTAVSFSQLKPADLVFFSCAGNGVVDHVGIYIGNGQFINASSSKGVIIYSMGPYWQSVFLGGRRVL